MSAGASAMRLRGLIRKEVLQIRRDPSSILLALVMPVVLLFLFGYGVSLDAENVPLAVVNDDGSAVSRELVARFALSRYFDTLHVFSLAEATRLVEQSRAEAILHIQSDFSDRLAYGTASVQVVLNGVESNQARLIEGYATGVIGKWSAIRLARGEPAAVTPVAVDPRIWFNEAAESRDFLVPGLVTLVMTLTGVLLTALVIAREWERGTMEAILATPLEIREFLVGKLVPYYALGMGGLALSVGLGVFLFEVPFRGSLLALFVLSSLFLLASLGIGLFISAATRMQFVAAQASMIIGFLPAFFLSGLLFDLHSTPWFVRLISRIVPARYFVSISHTLFLAGDVWSVLLPNAAVLGGMAVLFLVLARRRLSLRLSG